VEGRPGDSAWPDTPVEHGERNGSKATGSCYLAIGQLGDRGGSAEHPTAPVQSPPRSPAMLARGSQSPR
jgi:hypothetical protein